MERLAVLLFLITLSPSLVFAQSTNLSSTTAELQTQIQDLLKQVQALQQQVMELKVELGQQSETTAPAVPPELTRSLYRGSSGDDVRGLQEFLSQDKEIYPEGLVTGYFGPLTEEAVKRWQEKYGVESIGVIGPKTIARFNEFREQVATPAIPAQPIGLIGTTTIFAIPTQPATTTPTRPLPESCAASYNYCVGPTECSANGYYWCRNSCYGSIDACLGQTYVAPATSAMPAQPATQTTQPATPAISATSTNAASFDTVAPTVPTNLIATTASSTQINLSWTASTDTIGVTGYRIYRGGAQIATVATGASYSDTDLVAATAYSYTIAAYDAAGNISAQSSFVSATTLTITTASSLSQVQGLTATVFGSSVTLSWQPVPEWNGGPTTGGYNIYRGSSAGFTPSLTYPTDNHIAQGNVLSYTDSNLSPGTYYYKVAYQNNSGTVGPASTAASAVVSAPPPSSAPSIKTGTGVVGDSKTFSFGTGTIEYSMGGAGVSGYIYSGSPGSAGRTSPILNFANPTASDTTSCGPYPSAYLYQGITNICQFTSAANYAFSSAEDAVRIYDKSSPCYQGILLFKQNNLYGGIDPEDVDSAGALHYRYWYDESGGSNFSSLCQTSLNNISSLQKTASVLDALEGILRQIQGLLR